MSHRAALCGACLAIAAVLTMGQSSEFEGRTIVDIQYVPAQPLDSDDLAAAQPLKKGAPLRAEDVARAIDGLFATGRFQDIRVEAQPAPAGVIVRFVTVLTPFVGRVAITGKPGDPPSRAQLEQSTPLTQGETFHEADVEVAVQNLQRLLQANGYYAAQVHSSLDRNEPAQLVFFTFDIKLGKRAHYEAPIIHGDAKLPDGVIIHATGWRFPIIHIWRQVTDSRTRRGVTGIQKRYQKKDRLLATAKIEKLNYDAQHRRVQPVLDIDAGPKVQVKAVEAKVSKRNLKKYVPVFSEGAIDDDLLVEGARNLRDYFQSQGYYDVDVDFRRLPQKDDTVEIDYVIARGERSRLVRVDIVGNKYFQTAAIRERMFMQPASFLLLRHGRFSEAFQKKDAENISNLYKSNGFRDVKVTSTVHQNYAGKPGDIAVTVHIDEGPQYLVDRLTVNGVTSLNPGILRANLASTAGQPWSDVNIAADREYILRQYYSSGFPRAAFSFDVKRLADPYHVDLTYNIVEGERHYVRDVIVSGLETTRRSVVDRILTVKPGEPLSMTEITAMQRELYNLGVFASVDAAVENPQTAETHKYLLYNFDEANRYHLAVGVGAQIAQFGPTTANLRSPGGTTGFSPEFSLVLSRLNLFGLGHEVSLRGEYSDLEKRTSLDYMLPRFRNVDGQNITFTVLYDNSFDIRTFSSLRKQASIQVSRRLTNTINGFVRYSYSIDSVSNVVIPSLLISPLLQPQRVGMFTGNMVQDRRDNPGNPRRGIFNTIDAGLASTWFGGQRSFARVLVRNATYYPLPRNWILARQTEFGLIEAFNLPRGITAADAVPLPERFFGGGADTDRGFAFDQAGPRDIGANPSGVVVSQPTGFPLGGDAVFFNNVELRFPFIGPNIQGVLFEDMGNIFPKLSDVSFRVTQPSLQDFSYMVHAAGVGIRYKTPVGPIRLDLAYSINPPTFYGFNGSEQQLLACNPNTPTSQLPAVCTPVKQTLSHFQFFFSIGQTF